jgi:predicted nucleic acid-binding protein
MEGWPLTIKFPESALLDSSVILKWFRREETWREVALQLRQAYLDGQMLIYVPNLLIYEIANVLRYKPDLTQQQVQEALMSLYDMQIRIVEISQELIKEAIHFAYFHDITVYDATFVAMAEYLKVLFITADEKLIQKLDKVSYVQHISNLISL